MKNTLLIVTGILVGASVSLPANAQAFANGRKSMRQQAMQKFRASSAGQGDWAALKQALQSDSKLMADKQAVDAARTSGDREQMKAARTQLINDAKGNGTVQSALKQINDDRQTLINQMRSQFGGAPTSESPASSTTTPQ